MAGYSLSVKAGFDIEEILIHSLDNWGLEQAETYKEGLENCLTLLSKNPYLGASVEWTKTELRSFPYKSHIVFYLVREVDIYVIRILHQRMDYESYL